MSALAALPATSRAGAPIWQPAGVRPSTATLSQVVAKLYESDATAGAPATSRVERYAIENANGRVDALVRILGEDYAVEADLGGGHVRIGRRAGERWRANSGGTVHLIRADVQGDAFDRWPVSELGFSIADCALLGESDVPSKSWVLADRPALDIPRFLYVDESTGDVVREISREGTRVTTYDFSDVRGPAGSRRAYRWTTHGFGDDETVALERSEAAPVTRTDLAIPEQGAPIFSMPTSPRMLSTKITRYGTILVTLRLGGVEREFALDSGTTQIIIDGKIARPLGTAVLDHGIASDIDVDESLATNAPFLTTSFFYQGLLGYDFFRGKIVHVDYAARRVDILPRADFVAPTGAFPLATDWSEGMPIVSAMVGDRPGGRFLLDLGSFRLLLTRDFLDRTGPRTNVSAVPGDDTFLPYLEGNVAISTANSASLLLGNAMMNDVPTDVERADANDLSIPLDGIIGTEELSAFEWWFDADGPVTYFRRGGIFSR